MKRFFIFVVVGTFLLPLFLGGGSGCDGTGDETDSEILTILIDNLTFSPLNFEAQAGQMVRVANQDSETHTVTSQTAPNAFDNTGDEVNGFDTGNIGPGGEGEFEVPLGVSPGDVLHFYCETHLGTMATPNGTITVIP